jgi:hypothetical protein
MIVSPLSNFYNNNNFFLPQVRSYVAAIFLTMGKKNCSSMSLWSGVNRSILYNFLRNHDENIKSMKMFLEDLAVRAISESAQSSLLLDFTFLNKSFAYLIEELTYDYDGVTGRTGKGLSLGVCAVSTPKITIPLDYKPWMQKKLAGAKYVKKVELVMKLITECISKLKVNYIILDGAFACEDFLKFMQTITTPYIMRIPCNRNVEYEGNLVQIRDHPSLKLSKNQKAATVETKYKGIPCFITAHKRTGKRGAKEVVFLVSNAKMHPWDYIKTYERRWPIEKGNRTTKQSLGVGQNQTLMAKKQSAHIFATFVSYTLLQIPIMNNRKFSPEDVLRSLRLQNLELWKRQSIVQIETLMH